MTESAPQEHVKPLRRHKVSNGLDAAIQELLPAPIPRQSLIDLFEDRASFTAITAWRFGWRAPPQWAADLLGSKIQAKINRLAKRRAAIPVQIGGPGERGARHLRIWREQKARERDAKEKAASEAALRDE